MEDREEGNAMNETTVAGATGATHSGEEQAAAAPASKEDLRCYVCGGAYCYCDVMGLSVEGTTRTLWVCKRCLSETPAQRFERLESLKQDRDDALRAIASSRLAEECAAREAREMVEECRERAAERDDAIAERDRAIAELARCDASAVAWRLAEAEEDLRKMTWMRDYFRDYFRDMRAVCESLRLEVATACAERDAAISARGDAIIEAQQARQERDRWEARFRGWAQDLEIAARAARLGGGPA